MADQVFIRGESGVVLLYDLPLHEAIEDRLRKGYLKRVANAAGDPYVEGGDEIPTLPAERPAIAARKSDWVGWAVAQGMTPDDAEAATKQDLIEKFGTAPIAKTAEELAAEALAEKEAAEQAADDEAAAKAAAEQAEADKLAAEQAASNE